MADINPELEGNAYGGVVTKNARHAPLTDSGHIRPDAVPGYYAVSAQIKVNQILSCRGDTHKGEMSRPHKNILVLNVELRKKIIM